MARRHYLIRGRDASACGSQSKIFALHPEAVNCKRCRSTLSWMKAMRMRVSAWMAALTKDLPGWTWTRAAWPLEDEDENGMSISCHDEAGNFVIGISVTRDYTNLHTAEGFRAFKSVTDLKMLLQKSKRGSDGSDRSQRRITQDLQGR